MVKIRDASVDDAEALGYVRSLSWRSAYDGLLPAELIQTATRPDGGENIREFLRANQTRRALLAEDAGSPVGMAVYGPGRAMNGARRTTTGIPAELYAIYVLPDHWSRGVGRSLVELAIDGARFQGPRGSSCGYCRRTCARGVSTNGRASPPPRTRPSPRTATRSTRPGMNGRSTGMGERDELGRPA